MYSDAPAYDVSTDTDGPLYHEAALNGASSDAAESSEATYELATGANAVAELEPAYALAAGTTAATDAAPLYDVGTADDEPAYALAAGTTAAMDSNPVYDVGTADDEPAYALAAGTTATADFVAANGSVYAKPTLRRSAISQQLLYATLPEDEVGAGGKLKKSALGNGMVTKAHTFDLALKLRSVDEMLLETA